MDIKKILWIVFGFVIVGLIAVAVLVVVRAQISEMNDQVPSFPDTSTITDATPFTGASSLLIQNV